MTYMAHWFSERMEQLCKELKTSKSKLGQDAGLSHATIGKWIQAADAGKFSPRLEQVELLAKHTGKPVSWFLTEGGAASSPAQAKAPAGNITAKDLERVARRLTEFDEVSDDEAWLLMRNLVADDAEALYFAARDVLRMRAMQEHHSGTVGKINSSPTRVRRVKTS
jgi:transcriptional regulator with XRE-family HTH domain